MIKDHKFSPQQVMEIVLNGIKTALKKDNISWDKKANIEARITWDWNIKVLREYDTVEEIEDESRQMILEDAKKYNADAEIGTKVYFDITPENIVFSRIWAQAAAQTIKNDIKKIEKERFFDKFFDKQGELLKAKVLRAVWDTVLLDIEWTSVVLLPDGQVPGRMYNIWEEIFVLLKKIDKDANGVTLDITQSSNDFIEALLFKIIPELSEWKVEIDKIARFPWRRTKVVVQWLDKNVDPVWVFVWVRGSRISTVLTLLDGEKIDFIEQDIENDAKFVADCLKPARIKSVTIEWDKAIVHIDEDQKPVAIWKWASNIKLASELAGYVIDLRVD